MNHFFLKVMLSVFFLSATWVQAQEQRNVVLDADTGNEVDDFYALARILMEPNINVLALNAAHWQTSHWTIENSMENSHRLNQQLLGEMGLSLKTNRGAIARMYDWGDRAQHSAAAYEIIKQVKELPNGEKLNVIALGALTNVASAVFIDEQIASKIRLYWLGTTYDFTTGILRKDDFNCMMDPYALNMLLFSEVEMHVIPLNVASKLEFTFEETKAEIAKEPLGKFLVDRWYTHLDGARKKRVIWDLSIVDLFLYPDWGEQIEITTTKDNGSKKIFYYTSIDAQKMRTDFFEKIKAYRKK